MTEKNWLQNLTKSDTDKWIGGVCGGLGESSPIPSWVWRVLFVLLLFGPGFFIYILLWIFVPSKSKA
jgi:phage shock protein PspC (stress-responsive transcriptional regulator)